MVYTVTFNPAIDYVVALPGSLTPGSINRCTREEYQFGGKGINVSNMLRTLGVPTTALGFIGGFTGEALEKGLRRLGLTTDFIPTAQGQTRINVKIRTAPETEINGLGPTVTERELEQLYARLDKLAAGDVLVLSGSVPPGLPDSTYAALLERLRFKDILTAVDAAGNLLTQTLAHRPFLIKPNRQELEALFQRELSTDAAILDCAARLQRMGGRNILVSLAEQGALLLDETGQVHRAHCPRGQAVNSVGAGDSMVAGFLAGYLETGSYAHALKLGTAAGSATAFSIGLGSKDLTLELLKALQ